MELTLSRGTWTLGLNSSRNFERYAQDSVFSCYLKVVFFIRSICALFLGLFLLCLAASCLLFSLFVVLLRRTRKGKEDREIRAIDRPSEERGGTWEEDGLM